MDKIKLEILGLSSSQSQTGSFALVLGEKNGKRRLPIIIGMFEAQAIAIQIENIVPNRPMTHDLFKSFAGEFKYHVKEIVISDLKDGVFFAKIVCESEDKVSKIDARPSDAIAIGLRFNAPIFTYEKILLEAGIEFSGEEDNDFGEVKSELVTDKPSSKKTSSIQDESTDKLNELLKKAIDKEDYEQAAKIRDELGKRN